MVWVGESDIWWIIKNNKTCVDNDDGKDNGERYNAINSSEFLNKKMFVLKINKGQYLFIYKTFVGWRMIW